MGVRRVDAGSRPAEVVLVLREVSFLWAHGGDQELLVATALKVEERTVAKVLPNRHCWMAAGPRTLIVDRLKGFNLYSAGRPLTSR